MERLAATLTFAQAVEAMDGLPIVVAVTARMHEPWRHYHDGRHIAEIDGHLGAAEMAGVRIVDGVAARAFSKWHDAVYDAEAAHGRNEELSARLCEADVSSIAHDISVSRAAAAIRATVTHIPPDSRICPDGELLLDCDLAILGAHPERFDEYDGDIRLEYGHIPHATWRLRRPAVMARFGDRPRIYRTEWARDLWETQARANIARLIASYA